MSVAIGLALTLAWASAQGPIPPDNGGTTDQVQTRPSRVQNALRTAIASYRRGDYEAAATYFQQAQAGQDDLPAAERADLSSWLQLNATALQARREGVNQIRQADEAVKQGRFKDAYNILKAVTPNQQFLSAGDKQRMQQLLQQVQTGNTGTVPAANRLPATERTPATVFQGRSKLNQARLLMARGDYNAAQALATEVAQMGGSYQPGEDTPQKVLDDINKARLAAATPSDPKLALLAARAALDKGDLDEAERLARHADKNSSMWNSMSHLWGDSPAKVLKEVAAARAAKQPAKSPVPPAQVVDSRSPKPEPAKNHTEIARNLLKDARTALKAGNIAQAKELTQQARALKPDLNWWEENTPDKLLAEIRQVEGNRANATTGTAVAQTTKEKDQRGSTPKVVAPATKENDQPGSTPKVVAPATKESGAKEKSPDARALLSQARELYNSGHLDEAEKLARRAEALRPIRWGLFEKDTPDRLLTDIQKARSKHDQEESVRLLAEARKQYEQGHFAEAERLAVRAERLHGPYSVWELGDRPQKLIAEIHTAQRKERKTNVPPIPVEIARKDGSKPAVADGSKPTAADRSRPAVADRSKPVPADGGGGVVTAAAVSAPKPEEKTAQPPWMTPSPNTGSGDRNKVRAQALLTEARQLQREGRLLEARQKVMEAQHTGATFGPDEDRPELVLWALAALCKTRVEGLMQQANVDTTGDPVRMQRAESDLNQARELAAAFQLDTQPIDRKLAWLQQVKGQGAGLKGPGSGVGDTQVSQVQHQVLALPGNTANTAAPSATTSHGQTLLNQARLELRAGQTRTARRLAEEAFQPELGVQAEAAQVLRSIDAEEFNQKVLGANHAYDAGLDAFQRREYAKAGAIFRTLDSHLLTPDKQARLKELALAPELQPSAVAQVGAKVSADGAGTSSSPAGKAQATDFVPPPSTTPVARTTAQEADFAKQVQAMHEVKFQKLRADGLEVQREAMKQFQAGDTDRAIEMLQEYVGGLTQADLDSERVALLRRSIEARLQQFRTLKHQRDFEKLQTSQKENSTRAIAREALNEAEKKKQIAELMKQYQTFFHDGKYKEAEMYAMRAKELDPDDPVAGAAIYTARIQANQVAYKDIKRRKEDIFVKNLDDAEDPGPAVNSKDPVAIDAKIALENRNRKAIDLPNITGMRTEKEKEIYRKLDGPISSLDFKDTALRQVLDDLQGWTGINIVADEPALQEAGISLDRPVTMKLEGVALKSALNLLLHQVHLTYVVQNEVLTITTEEHARGKMVTKLHQVTDLVIPVVNAAANDASPILRTLAQANEVSNANLKVGTAPYLSANSMAGGSPVSQSQSAGGMPGTGGGWTQTRDTARGTSEDVLIKLITSTIAPQSWASVGGQGTIDFFPLSMALVVTQTPDIQEQVADLLAALRRLLDQEVAVEVRLISVGESFFERIGLDFAVNIRNNNSKYGPQIVSQQFQPFGFINNFSPKNFISGLTQTGAGGFGTGSTPGLNFTQDLGIPIKAQSFGLAVPPFGAFPNSPGANGGIDLGLAFLSDIEVFMFLEAAQGNERTNVMQAPKLTLLNGQTSSLTFTDAQFFAINVTVAQVGGQLVFIPNNTPLPIGGLQLTMQAIISADRRFVRLQFTNFTLNNLATANVPLFPITSFISPIFEGGAAGQPVPFTQFLQQPVLNSITVTTSVNVPDGGTVLLGGLKRLSEGRNEFGPPVLSKIPYINRLFKNVGYGREADSIMMMVTPRIIINEEEEQKLLGSAGPAPGAPGQ
jgi:type II secretory pathway component GspD/PulD (secretin)/tetratricopeptide (TPR) repeat protein